MAKREYTPVQLPNGQWELREFEGKELSNVRSYHSRLGWALDTGMTESLRNTPATTVRDTSGRTYRLSTDFNRMSRKMHSMTPQEREAFNRGFGSR